MSADHRHASGYLERLLRGRTQEELVRRLAPRTENPAAKIPGGADLSAEALDRRWALLPGAADARAALLDPIEALRFE